MIAYDPIPDTLGVSADPQVGRCMLWARTRVRYLRDRTGRVSPLWDSSGMARFGCGRVSTRGQKDDSQIDALTAAGCERIWVDKASGKLARRPEWDKCLVFRRLLPEPPIRRDEYFCWPCTVNRR